MGEKGRAKIVEITLIGNRRADAGSDVEGHMTGYVAIVFEETPEKYRSITLKYSPSPFKGSHRAIRGDRFEINACYNVKDERIAHIAFGNFCRTHPTMYYAWSFNV